MPRKRSRNQVGAIPEGATCHQPQDVTKEVVDLATQFLLGMKLPGEFLSVAMKNLHFTGTFPAPGELEDYKDEVVILNVNDEFPLLGAIVLVGEALHSVMREFMPKATDNGCFHLIRFAETLHETIWGIAELASFSHPGFSPCGLRCQGGKLALTARPASERQQLEHAMFNQLVGLLGAARRDAQGDRPSISVKDLDLQGIGAFAPFKQ